MLRGRGARPVHGLDIAPVGDANEFYAVGAKKMRFVGSDADNDRSSIRFNDRITLSGIRRRASLPSEQQVRGGQVKTDKNSDMGKDPEDLIARGRRPALHPHPTCPRRDRLRGDLAVIDAMPPLEVREQP